ncbi:GlsB/YeaQ/YmgE family stress response membrane protein [Sphingomonas sp.]|uniref:GlsB/YeaQ/YmgE family stress response membrane protein n=1 Tax=Sphingomonas sp. TaxID=28214 RepID=UPI003AFFD0FB
MNFIIWLILGGIIGWLASIVMRTDAQQGAFLNIVVGVVGSFIGGFVLRSFGKINNNDFSISSLFAAFVGAIILLAIVNLVRRGSVR